MASITSSRGELVDALLSGTLSPPTHSHEPLTKSGRKKRLHDTSKSVKGGDLRMASILKERDVEWYLSRARSYLPHPNNHGRFENIKIPQWCPATVFYAEEGVGWTGKQAVCHTTMLILDAGSYDRPTQMTPQNGNFQQLSEPTVVFSTRPKNNTRRPRFKRKLDDSGEPVIGQIQREEGDDWDRELIPDVAFVHATNQPKKNVVLTENNKDSWRFYNILEFKGKGLIPWDGFRVIIKAGTQPQRPKRGRHNKDAAAISLAFCQIHKQATAYSIGTRQPFVAIYDESVLYLIYFSDMVIKATEAEQWAEGVGQTYEVCIVDDPAYHVLGKLGHHLRSLDHSIAQAARGL